MAGYSLFMDQSQRANSLARYSFDPIFTGYLKHSRVSHPSIGLCSKTRIMNSRPVNVCLSLDVSKSSF